MTITTYFLAPNARWQGRDTTGQPCIDGKLFTYQTGTDDPKPTYSDPNGVNPNANPVELDGKGEANIYWVNDGTLYRIVLFDKDGNEVYSQDNYPTLKDTNIPPSPDEGTEHNFVRNPQFTWWNNTTNFQSYTTARDINDNIVDDWYFTRNNNNATINISQGVFDYGQSVVPANPLYYLHYECSSIGAGGETQKFFGQTYTGAQTFAGETISFGIWAKSDTSSTISLSVIQQFGTGGSPSAAVVTSVLSINLTTEWVFYPATVTVPSVAGKTPGTNGDDIFIFAVNMPLNAFASIDLANVQIQQLSEPTAVFPYVTTNEQFLNLTSQIANAVFKTGYHITGVIPTALPGFVMCDDGTLGNTVSNATHAFWGTKALFQYIWNTFPNPYAPIFNQDGTIGTRGATAELDYFANKSLALTKTVGRVLATAGAASLSAVIQGVDPATDELAITDTTSFYTGTPVTFTTTGTLPAPLAPATAYYIIQVSSILFKLAATLADAVATPPVPINITTAGSGTNIVLINYSNWLPGQTAGEIGHSLTEPEDGPHTHPYEEAQSAGATSASGSSENTFANNLGANTLSSGDGLPHNTMQPTVFLYTQVKL